MGVDRGGRLLGMGSDPHPGQRRGPPSRAVQRPAHGRALLTHQCQCPRWPEQRPVGGTTQEPSYSSGAQRPALASLSQPQRLGRGSCPESSAGWSSLPALPCAQVPPPCAPPGGLLSPHPGPAGCKQEQSLAGAGRLGTSPRV